MIDEKIDRRFYRAILLFFLIWFLFIENSAFVFWKFIGINECGIVAGTIYFNNGVTPLQINKDSSTFVELMNTTTDSRIADFTSDNFGRFTSPQVPQGSYYLKVLLDDKVIGSSTAFDVNANQVTYIDIRASMKSIN